MAAKHFLTVGLGLFASMSGFLFSPLAQSADLYFYDGANRIALTMDSEKWADVKDGVSTSIRSANSQEKSMIAATKSIVGKSASSSTSMAAGSPVFKSSFSGSTMALAGGVIVVPKDGDTKAEENLSKRGLRIIRKIGATGALLVASDQGMASLYLANKLHESGEFASASPNWWRDRVKK